MYYPRNGTGLRLQSLDGLQGDLGSENAYGTRRPTAGAYALLIPGWGPKMKEFGLLHVPCTKRTQHLVMRLLDKKLMVHYTTVVMTPIVPNDFTQVITMVFLVHGC